MTQTPPIQLRRVHMSDLPLFFAHQQDTEANYMAAFTSKDPTDRAAFDAHWAKIMANDTITIQTILYNDEVAGHIASFIMEGETELTYWLGRDYWGQGIATQALTLFLAHLPTRPLYARVVHDNNGSRRVLEKCGFTIIGTDTGYANARAQEIEEYILRLP